MENNRLQTMTKKHLELPHSDWATLKTEIIRQCGESTRGFRPSSMNHGKGKCQLKYKGLILSDTDSIDEHTGVYMKLMDHRNSAT